MSLHLTSQAADCCRASAVNAEAAFCDDCGKPIRRCMAAAECGGVLDAAGLCSVCVQPEFLLDAGAATTVRVGGKLALPLIIRNASQIGRPLFITSLWISEDDEPPRAITLPFQRLEPNDQASVGVRTGILDHAGMHQVDLLIGVSTRYQWLEEEYIFSSSIIFPVESDAKDGPSTTVVVNAETVGAGFTVYNPTRIEQERASGQGGAVQPIPLQKVRADAAERNYHVRGYKNGTVIARDVAFEWKGFAADDVPFADLPLAQNGLLSFGRNGTQIESGANDVCLKVDGPNGLNKDATLQISRHHFTLYLSNGRLMLRVDSQFGLRVNGDAYGRTKTVEINDGDVISPLRKSPDALSLAVSFEANGPSVNRIVVRRASLGRG